jgi:hypothetical protein
VNRIELDEKARQAGVSEPEKLDRKADVIAAIQAAEQAPTQRPGFLVEVQEDGTYAVTPVGGIGPYAVPTHLRKAANEIEKALVGD